MIDFKLMACRITGHRPEPATVWNDGYHFGRCKRCVCELVRGKGAWTPVPRGFRIAWKPRRPGDVVWADWTPAQASVRVAGNPVHDLQNAIELRIVSTGDAAPAPAHAPVRRDKRRAA